MQDGKREDCGRENEKGTVPVRQTLANGVAAGWPRRNRRSCFRYYSIFGQYPRNSRKNFTSVAL